MENDLSIDSRLIGSALERAGVSVPAPPEPDSGEKPREAPALRTFILRAAAAGRIYALLAMKTAGTRAHRELHAMAREERDTEKALQTEYLILTGDTVAVPRARQDVLYLIRALRDAYAAELMNADAYDREAQSLPDCALRRLYQRLARRERAHAAVLRRIIAGTIT